MFTEFLTALVNRAVISISGEDAQSFLQRVLTFGPEGITPEHAQFSTLLTPQGKILADMIIFADENATLYFDVPASEKDALLKRFKMYRLRSKAEIEVRDDLIVAAARGSGQEEISMVAIAASRDPRHRDLGLRAIVPSGGPTTDIAEYHWARIPLGVPEFSEDFGPSERFSTDVNHDLLGGIDYKKGCFVGQEVASRMHRKGGVRKRTLPVQAETQLNIGDEILAGETGLGMVTSSAGKHSLALLRIDRVAKALKAGEALKINGGVIQISDPFEILKDATAL
jgi:folate-binding protein YgfZ